MKRVLVTGMSGVGKSALLNELAARGYQTVDTDHGDYYETVDGEPLWRRDRIEAMLRAAGNDCNDVLFVQGTTRNQGSFYPWFDHIVLLSAPVEVLVQRLTTRTTNSYGTRANSPRLLSTWRRWSPCCEGLRPSRWSRPSRCPPSPTSSWHTSCDRGPTRRRLGLIYHPVKSRSWG